jgi:hypothetical protein
MATHCEATVHVAGVPITITADSYPELHREIAGLQEIERDATYLRREHGADDIRFEFRVDADGNKYYGFRAGEHSVTLGQSRGDQGRFPLFPKGEEGYYNYAEGSRPRRAPSSGRASESGASRPAEEEGSTADEYEVRIEKMKAWLQSLDANQLSKGIEAAAERVSDWPPRPRERALQIIEAEEERLADDDPFEPDEELPF